MGILTGFLFFFLNYNIIVLEHNWELTLEYEHWLYNLQIIIWKEAKSLQHNKLRGPTGNYNWSLRHVQIV